MPKPGDLIAGKYKIESIIGEGGMGSVFAATHSLTGKRMAVKWMLPDLARDADAVHRFLREAQAAGRIDHPNVVDVYDVGEHAGSPFLVMELLHGETLTEGLGRGGYTARDIIELLLPAMRGVAAAHRMGVVHRDLKPENIFLARDTDGNYIGPKVLDFGISKVSTEGQVDPRLTKTGAVVGTPYYMSPEQIRGSADVDKRADVYAFGIILYECLTGRVPFDAETYSALILEIATGTARRPRELNPELPEPLEAIVLKAMARERDQRYPDLESLIEALEPFASRVTFSVRASNPAHRRLTTAQVTSTPFVSELPAPMPPAPNWIGIGMGAAAIVLVGSIGGFWAFGRDKSAPDPSTQAAQSPAAVVSPAPVPAAPTLAPPPPATASAPVPATLAAPDAGARQAATAPLQIAPQEATPPQAMPAAVPAPTPAQPPPAVTDRRGTRRPERDARREAPAAAATAEPAPPRSAAKPTGRTGALGVEDF